MIPNIIHQIYISKEGVIPDKVKSWMDKTKSVNSDFEYRLWSSRKEIYSFVKENFPYYYDKFISLEYDVQRIDIFRFMVLYVLGGVYLDTDIECQKNIYELIKDKTCCFGMEPQEHADDLRLPKLIGTFFIASERNNQMILDLLDKMFSCVGVKYSTHNPTQIMKSTGPFRVNDFLIEHSQEYDFQLIPSRLVAPIQQKDMTKYMCGRYFDVSSAYMIHLFAGSWVDNSENKDELEMIDLIKIFKK